MGDVLELDAIISQVLRNCSISDSQHAGLYSVCGLALRLRDLSLRPQIVISPLVVKFVFFLAEDI